MSTRDALLVVFVRTRPCKCCRNLCEMVQQTHDVELQMGGCGDSRVSGSCITPFFLVRDCAKRGPSGIPCLRFRRRRSNGSLPIGLRVPPEGGVVASPTSFQVVPPFVPAEIPQVLEPDADGLVYFDDLSQYQVRFLPRYTIKHLITS